MAPVKALGSSSRPPPTCSSELHASTNPLARLPAAGGRRNREGAGGKRRWAAATVAYKRRRPPLSQAGSSRRPSGRERPRPRPPPHLLACSRPLRSPSSARHGHLRTVPVCGDPAACFVHSPRGRRKGTNHSPY